MNKMLRRLLNKTNRSNDAKLESSILDKAVNEQILDIHLHLKTCQVSKKEVGFTTNNSTVLLL